LPRIRWALGILEIEPDEEWVRANVVVDELAIARANIEDGVRGVDIILEEVPTEHLPDAVFARFVFRAEPRRAEPSQLHVTHGVRVTLCSEVGKAFSVARVRRQRKWDCEVGVVTAGSRRQFAPWSDFVEPAVRISGLKETNARSDRIATGEPVPPNLYQRGITMPSVPPLQTTYIHAVAYARLFLEMIDHIFPGQKYVIFTRERRPASGV
jgi:hypothetical protein